MLRFSIAVAAYSCLISHITVSCCVEHDDVLMSCNIGNNMTARQNLTYRFGDDYHRIEVYSLEVFGKQTCSVSKPAAFSRGFLFDCSSTCATDADVQRIQGGAKETVAMQDTTC